MGQQILAGHIPYRDIWDHKGHFIYYLDALGLVIGGNTRWGIWFLEFSSLYIAALSSQLNYAEILWSLTGAVLDCSLADECAAGP